MRRVKYGNGASVLHRLFAGSWSQNPWINPSHVSVQPALPDSIDRQQQKAAIRIWEDEGGSIAAPSRTLDLQPRAKMREPAESRRR